MRNLYIDDGIMFLRRVLPAVDEKSTEEDLLFAVLFFALGMEKVLKGILFDLNPAYVYKVQDFKNTVTLLYQDKLLPTYVNNGEISSKPDGDVLTFKLSLQRAKAISKSTENHTSLLFTLSNYRDIIVHNTVNLLEPNKLRKLVLADFYPLVLDYCKELDLGVDEILGGSAFKIADISARNQESPGARIKLKIVNHQRKWHELRNMSGYVSKMTDRTELMKGFRSKTGFYKMTECPACKNPSLIRVEVDLEEFDDRLMPVGAFVTNLKCEFCKFTVEDYDEIDFLKLNDLLAPEDISE